MYISIDMGGTNTRIGSSRNLRGFVAIRRFSTNQDVTIQRAKLVDSIDFVQLDEKISALVIGVPGQFDNDTSTFTKIPNIDKLNTKNFSELLGEGKNLFVENDAVLAGLGEASYGAGRTHTRFGYITLGTGVGGCLIETTGGAHGFTRKEPGHDIILENGKSFEKNLGGKYFAENYGVSAERCIDGAVWQKYSDLLFEGLKRVSKDWDVDTFVIGGNISKKFDSFAPQIENANDRLTLERCQLLDNSGIYGGLVYLRGVKGFESVA